MRAFLMAMVLVTSLPSVAAVYEVGTFTQSTAGVGAQTFNHALGKTPKAIIVWSEGRTALETTQGGASPIFGFSDGSSSAVIAGVSADAANPRDDHRFFTADVVLFLQGMTVAARAQLTSFSATQVKLQWSVNDDVPRRIHYLLLGGDEVSAKVVVWACPAAPQAITVGGFGFQPEGVVTLYGGSTVSSFPTVTYGTNSHVHLGVMSAAGSWIVGADSSPQAGGGLVHYTLAEAVGITQGDAYYVEALLTGFTADGFSLDFTQVANNPAFVSLGLSGVPIKAGTFKQTGAGNTFAQTVSGLGFLPGAVLASTVFEPGGIIKGTTQLAVGAADGTHSAGAALNDATSTPPSSVRAKESATTMIAPPSQGPTDTMALKSVANGSFTVQWSNAQTAGMEVNYVAFGGVIAPPPPPDAGTLTDAGVTTPDGGVASVDGGALDPDAGVETLADGGALLPPPDGGADPLAPSHFIIGCGCDSSEVPVGLLALVLLLGVRRRK